MDENKETSRGKRQRSDIQELIDRCTAMDKELSALKKRMLEIQQQVEGDLGRRRKEESR